MAISSNPPPSAVVAALSAPRLSNYRTFFGTSDEAELLGLYAWNQHLSDGFFELISNVEIVLRNQFHSQLSAVYGVAGYPGSRDWYLHLRLTADSYRSVQKVLNRRRPARAPVPSPDDVVSKLTFGFWPYMLDVSADLVGNPVSWGPLLTSMLPGNRNSSPTHWARQVHQDALFARLDLCNEIRNRIAHHEPIWKLGPLLDEARDRPLAPRQTVAARPSGPSDALARLLLINDRIVELLRWLSPAAANWYIGCGGDARIRTMLSLQTLARYQAGPAAAEIDISQLRSRSDVRGTLRDAARQALPIRFVDGTQTLGHWRCP